MVKVQRDRGLFVPNHFRPVREFSRDIQRPSWDWSRYQSLSRTTIRYSLDGYVTLLEQIELKYFESTQAKRGNPHRPTFVSDCRDRVQKAQAMGGLLKPNETRFTVLFLLPVHEFMKLPPHQLTHFMNIHHLELFYYVARFGGIMEAVRNIPYGIQQPAVSGQVGQLEEFLGVTLFKRRPFSLTPEGEKLYKFVQPFFSNLDRVANDIQGGQARQFRIGASTIILRDHLPGLIQELKRKFCGLNISLREGFPAHLESLLHNEEIDLAITLMDSRPGGSIHSLVLMELELVLLVPNHSRIKTAEQLWACDKIEDPLICLPPGEALCRNFQQRLAELGIDWFPSIEASSVDLIETYVAHGLGIGVSVGIPRKILPPTVRMVPLTGFPTVSIGAMWRGKTTPLLEECLNELKSKAKRLSGM